MGSEALMGSRNIKSTVIKSLYANSGNCCAFPGCRCILIDGNVNIGEICHIEGLNPDSARYNPHLTNEESNSIENLILLCPNHHSLIDRDDDVYTVERLRDMKATHETHVKEQMSQVDFFTELHRIFQECQFDMIFLEQNFETPFPDWYFEKVMEGYYRIRNLLNGNCSLCVPSEDRKQLYYFTQLAEYVLTGVGMNTNPNGSGYAIPNYNAQDLEATRKNMTSLVEIYIQYRFN